MVAAKAVQVLSSVQRHRSLGGFGSQGRNLAGLEEAETGAKGL